MDFENRYACKDGSYRWLAWHATPAQSDGLIFAVAKDVTDRRRREEEARILSEENPHPILRLGLDGTVRYANLVGHKLLLEPWGVSLGGRAVDELLKAVAALDGSPSELELVVGQRHFHFVLAPAPEGVNVYGRDFTQKKKLETRLLQSQKMEVVGRLAGGVAHDFNNLLTAIGGCVHFLRQDIPKEDPSRQDIEEIGASCERAAALTRQLLAFSRQQVVSPEALDLNQVVHGVAGLLKRLLGEDVALETRLEPGLAPVRADRTQLEQVILNLAVNARDAMPGGGKLTVETRRAELSPEYAKSHPEARPGPHVMLAVSDTGSGMDAATLARLFEPFFTTKEPGKGTGLGLSTVYGIVRQCGGSISVYSEPGHGSVFKVFLPVLPDGTASQVEAARSPAAAAGLGTVLLVEDDAGVRRFVGRLLREAGYTVAEAAAPKEALLEFSDPARPLGLLLTDLVLPGMRGEELAAALTAKRPGLRIIFMSGYTEAGLVRVDLPESGAKFLQKPLEAQTLLRTVGEMLKTGGSHE